MSTALPLLLAPESSLRVNYSFDMDLGRGLTADHIEQLFDMLRVHGDFRTLVLVKRKVDRLVAEEATIAVREFRTCRGCTNPVPDDVDAVVPVQPGTAAGRMALSW